jgi:hypothetical protein
MIREGIAALVEGRSLTEAEAAALLGPEAQASAWAGSRVRARGGARLKPGLRVQMYEGIGRGMP